MAPLVASVKVPACCMRWSPCTAPRRARFTRTWACVRRACATVALRGASCWAPSVLARGHGTMRCSATTGANAGRLHGDTAESRRLLHSPVLHTAPRHASGCHGRHRAVPGHACRSGGRGGQAPTQQDFDWYEPRADASPPASAWICTNVWSCACPAARRYDNRQASGERHRHHRHPSAVAHVPHDPPTCVAERVAWGGASLARTESRLIGVRARVRVAWVATVVFASDGVGVWALELAANVCAHLAAMLLAFLVVALIDGWCVTCPCCAPALREAHWPANLATSGSSRLLCPTT